MVKEMPKKTYETAEINICYIERADIVTTSSPWQEEVGGEWS